MTRSARTDSPRQVWPERISGEEGGGGGGAHCGGGGLSIHRVFKTLPCWHLCLAPTVVTITSALLGMTRSARTDSPRQVWPERISGEEGGGGGGAHCGGGGLREERGGGHNLVITDSACKNQLVVFSVQYGPFNPYIPIRSTTIGKSRVAKDPIAMHTSWRSNSDIASVTRTNQYNQDLELIHSTNGNHLESPKEGSSIDHQVTIYLHAQNITMFPNNETWYLASQILVSNSGGLILIMTAQSTRNMFRIHSDY
ncbi:triacylglycerol lipase [Dorcoceras hygrometricum]|uniref:Triacylglycerol lipase n=1 Tax=Dorcoceras hygrometricum TaxID=472368 RepID=A0A2Z7D0K2_9LAMI|nr:triacylglycerol lipase [Dorcoceras hygrometricum]